MKQSFRQTFVTAAVLSTLAHAGAARAAVDCQTLPRPVFATGSTAIKPLLAEIAKILVASPAQPDGGTPSSITIVYAGVGSCIGVDAIVNGTPLKSTSYSYWDNQGTEQTCTAELDAGSIIADIGVSDVFPSTCMSLPNGLPSNVHDFLGPVQTMTFVVPHASTETVISAEAAYNVFGFGADSGVDPWVDESVILRRNDQSGTQRMIARAIGVDASVWKGTATASSSDLRQRVVAAGASKPDATIGILAADEADDNRATLNVLAYQHLGQTCGYHPDHDPSSNEKQNVRDGHYLIWGPMHLLTNVDDKEHPRSQLAGDVIAYVTGTKSPPVGLDLIHLEAQRHVVPQCAMRVSRKQEIGPLEAFSPTEPCGCYYDKVANGRTTCSPCNSDGDCGAGRICSYHFCEMP